VMREVVRASGEGGGKGGGGDGGAGDGSGDAGGVGWRWRRDRCCAAASEATIIPSTPSMPRPVRGDLPPTERLMSACSRFMWP
jgi:hypothetical protein